MEFKCNTCDIKYTNKSSLSTHVFRKHKEFKNIKCECGYSPKLSQSLNAHYRHCLVHRHGEQPIPPGNKGKPSKLKDLTLIQRYGEEKAKLIKAKMAASQRNVKRRPLSTLAKRNISIARINYIESVSNRGTEWYAVGNLKVQGTWERMVAEKLLSAGIELTRPRINFSIHRHYTPDFYLPQLNMYLEIKGWMSNRNIETYKQYY